MQKHIKSDEFKRWCERPEVGYLDDFTTPGEQAVIVGESPNTDLIVNSIIFNFSQQNYGRYHDNGWEIQVGHEHAQPIVDIEFGREGHFDFMRPDLLFITLDPKRGEMKPKGISMVMGRIMLYRRAKRKPLYLISHIGGSILYNHYTPKMQVHDTDFPAMLRQLPQVLSKDWAPKVLNGI